MLPQNISLTSIVCPSAKLEDILSQTKELTYSITNKDLLFILAGTNNTISNDYMRSFSSALDNVKSLSNFT